MGSGGCGESRWGVESAGEERRKTHFSRRSLGCTGHNIVWPWAIWIRRSGVQNDLPGYNVEGEVEREIQIFSLYRAHWLAVLNATAPRIQEYSQSKSSVIFHQRREKCECQLSSYMSGFLRSEFRYLAHSLNTSWLHDHLFGGWNSDTLGFSILPQLFICFLDCWVKNLVNFCDWAGQNCQFIGRCTMSQVGWKHACTIILAQQK